jgi:hypothetical protein
MVAIEDRRRCAPRNPRRRKCAAVLASKKHRSSAPAGQEARMVRFGLFVFALSLAPAAAHAECSSEDRISYAQMGYTEAQIDAQCNGSSAPVDGPQSFAAAVCVTPAGYCPLSSSMAAGSSCICDSQDGPIPGVAQ